MAENQFAVIDTLSPELRDQLQTIALGKLDTDGFSHIAEHLSSTFDVAWQSYKDFDYGKQFEEENATEIDMSEFSH